VFEIFDVFKNKSGMIIEAENAKFKPNFIIQTLIFIAVFFVSQIVATIPFLIKMFFDMISGKMSSNNYVETIVEDSTLLMLFCTIIVIALTVVYCKFIEKRSLSSMGFSKSKAVKDYFLGLLIGFLMFSSSVFLSFSLGTLSYEGFVLGNSLGIILIFFLGFFFQGASEEILLRGYFMISLTTRAPIIVAVLLNSTVFAIMHTLNNGITVLSIINLTLFGIFASIYTLKANNLWGICAIHTIWNFVQGNVYGIRVSGMELKASIFSFSPTKHGTLINGGDFGLEGGLAVTLVLFLSIIITMFIKGRSVSQDKELIYN